MTGDSVDARARCLRSLELERMGPARPDPSLKSRDFPEYPIDRRKSQRQKHTIDKADVAGPNLYTAPRRYIARQHNGGTFI